MVDYYAKEKSTYKYRAASVESQFLDHAADDKTKASRIKARYQPADKITMAVKLDSVRFSKKNCTASFMYTFSTTKTQHGITDPTAANFIS